ncbi:VWA domain-containing protein [Thiocapsa imhoffii]|uniref:VWA domain-containing protein n=1 Tax=Thiocapsa imhoffii TaxID=382777 RepID=UPI0030B8C836
MWPVELQLLRPVWLLALVPAAALLLFLWRRPSQRLVWQRLVDRHLLAHLLVERDGAPRRLPLILLGLGWLLAILALAGPAWEREVQPLFGRDAARVILLDLSPSMNAADQRPSRLARARFEILDLLKASDDGQVALIAFGPAPFLVSPLTRDANTIAVQVPRLTTDLIPIVGARETAQALREAGELLDQAGATRGEVILVTDAVTDMASTRAAVTRLVADGHRVSVLAVGTEQGAPVPLEHGAGAVAGRFEQDANGGIRIARLDPGPLRELARLGRGRYVEAEPGDADTRVLLGQSEGGGAVVEHSGLQSDQWREEGPWLLLLLLPLAALAFRRGWLVPAVAVVLILPPHPSWAWEWADLWSRPDQRAARELAAGAAEQAAEVFEDPAWQAAARYQAGDYARALESLAELSDLDADYNRGNALARLGRWDDAIAAYEAVLSRDPDHQDARHNLELVQALRERPPDADADDAAGDSASDDPGDSDQAQSDQTTADSTGADSNAAESDPDDPTSADAGDPAGSDDQASGADAAADGQEDADLTQDERQPEAQDQSGSSAQLRGDDATSDSSGGDDIRPSDRPDAAEPRETDDAEIRDALDQALDADQEASTLEEMEASAGAPMDANRGARDPAAAEREQALEAQLRRVPDDPSELLRQRFILQQLRREGRLP